MDGCILRNEKASPTGSFRRSLLVQNRGRRCRRHCSRENRRFALRRELAEKKKSFSSFHVGAEVNIVSHKTDELEMDQAIVDSGIIDGVNFNGRTVTSQASIFCLAVRLTSSRLGE
ncbi:hypothetical protein AAMO2058_000998700 [Amorphochlora amoebiformis]